MGNVKDGLYDTNNDDYLVSDVQSINDNDASTANYFKDEIKAIQKKLTSWKPCRRAVQDHYRKSPMKQLMIIRQLQNR
jgi:hypothetical protein